MTGLWRPQRWYLGTVRQWHWVSSAVCLVGMLLFAITGITLNHAAAIPAAPVTEALTAELPVAMVQRLTAPESKRAPLPPVLRQWLARELGVQVPASTRAEWGPDDIYVGLPRPGGDAWLSLDLLTGEVFYEHTRRGWIAYLNDLHKGRDTGAAWRWFIDGFAIACVVFCLSGLLLLWRHSVQRPSTWPMVGLGLVVPLLLVLLFIH